MNNVTHLIHNVANGHATEGVERHIEAERELVESNLREFSIARRTRCQNHFDELKLDDMTLEKCADFCRAQVYLLLQ